ncbi:MAG: mechanosensitive ion channel, partial [Desulfovibrionaceae bacterium]|nr:mechanosensitive ion channel [Desulfovibrionaceae bacterium]
MPFASSAAGCSGRRSVLTVFCLAFFLAFAVPSALVQAAGENDAAAPASGQSSASGKAAQADTGKTASAADSAQKQGAGRAASAKASAEKKSAGKAEGEKKTAAGGSSGGTGTDSASKTTDKGGAAGETVNESGKLTEAAAEALAKEALRKEAENAQRAAIQAADTETKRKEAEEISQNDLLDDIWTSQRSRLTAVIDESTRLSETFLKSAGVLEQLRPVEQDIRRLLIMVSEFKQWPSALEAVNRRLGISGDLANSLVISAASPQVSALKLLEQLNTSVESLDEMLVSHHDETEDYLTRINTARFMLTAIIARYASALAPTRALVDRVREARADITKQLPELWLDYYTSGPVPWLNLSEWRAVPQNLSHFSVGLSLRQYVELPLTTSQWQGALSRFLIVLLSVGCLSLVIVNRVLQGYPEIQAHLKRYSLPWNVLGVALLAAAFTSTLEPFKLFMALGNLSLIIGQITLAWDLRRIKFNDVTVTRSPLLALMPLTLGAYALVYMPLPQLVTLVVWLIFLTGNIIYIHRTKKPMEIGRMQLEQSIMDMQMLILWPCLIVCLFGFHFYSIAIYLLYSSLSIAIQISVASLSIISRLNESLNNDDGRTMLSSFLLALAAPLVLMLAFGALSLWLATLPGGLDMLQFYIFKSVSIGETQLNFVQVLLIATAFFLARTAARMGKSLISRLHDQNSKIDSSLITPLQTVYFYLVWFCFILFTLRSLGMNLSNLAVIAGGLSVGIGFGMQTIVNNFISGIILIFSRTLQVGDIVEVGGVVGRI